MSGRNAWNYQESLGLGLVEYMEWCDDLGIEPSKSPVPLHNWQQAHFKQF